MNGAHVSGAAIGATLGAVAASLLNKYGFKVDDATAALIGAALVALGVGVGHVVATTGIFPALKQAFFGPKVVPVGRSVVGYREDSTNTLEKIVAAQAAAAPSQATPTTGIPGPPPPLA